MRGYNLVLLVVVLLALTGLGYIIFQASTNENNITSIVNPTLPVPTSITDQLLTNEETFDLEEQNDSKQSGKAMLIDENGQVKVVLELTSSTTLPQPAHIHLGSCPNPGAIKYSLNSVLNGKSETLLNISMEQLEKELPLAINVHKSESESGVYVSCGNVYF